MRCDRHRGAQTADGDAARGEARFQDCAPCHKLEAGANNVRPSLHGIFSRKAGELGDFHYSPAIKRSGIVWSLRRSTSSSPIRKPWCRPIACPMPAWPAPMTAPTSSPTC